jgi:putative endonuclease
MPAIIPHTTKQIGDAGEAVAADYLVAQGLRVLERNFRVKGGEIDLICRDGGATVFIEVRRRARADFGGAAASITAKKQQRLILAARHWLARHGEVPCRFDCVLFDGQQLTWLKNAFTAD